MRVEPAGDGWSPANDALARAGAVIAFSVTDTGIGITTELQQRDLRGVRPGRRHDRPPVRRHRAGPVDQPRAGPAARRRDRARRSTPGRGQHVHRLPAVDVARRPTAARRSRRRGARGRRRRSPRRRAAVHGAPASGAERRRSTRGSAGHEGAGRRRRLPQHLRADRAARARQARGRLGARAAQEALAMLEADARHRHRARWTS